LDLTGCSRWIYRIDVQQGNIVTQDMLAQLHPGMEKDKVRFIMGTPLIVDVFHDSRWDYIYSSQPGGKQREQRTVSLYFNKNGTLARVAGDVKTANHPLEPTPRRDATIDVPVPEEKKSLWARMFGHEKPKEEGKSTSLAFRKPGSGKPESKPTPTGNSKKGVLGGILGGRSPRAPEPEASGGGGSTGGGLNTN
jgi:outer membrane protein assembly factor BamE